MKNVILISLLLISGDVLGFPVQKIEESKQKTTLFRKLARPIKEIQELRRKKEAGTVSLQELKRLNALYFTIFALTTIALGLGAEGILYWLIKKHNMVVILMMMYFINFVYQSLNL